MTTLTEFLLARITEDENLAQMMAQIVGGVDRIPGLVSPGRVLAECNAKRRIVEQYIAFLSLPTDQRVEQRETLRWTCELLALPYSDHPDYREEWRP